MSRSILVIDDDQAIVDSLVMLLEDEGYDVKTVVNAPQLQQTTVEQFDLVLLDLWMSGMDGAEG